MLVEEMTEEMREEMRARGRREALAQGFPKIMPLGHLTLLVGDPGSGKSLVALDLAARLTSGRMGELTGEVLRGEGDGKRTWFRWDEMPEEDGGRGWEEFCQRRVVPGPGERETLAGRFGIAWYQSMEDDEDFIRRRIKACGPGGVQRLRGPDLTLVPEKGKKESALVAHLHYEVEGLGLRLLVLDPLPAFLGWQEGRGAATVRGLLQPVLREAWEHGFAVLGVTHLKKGRGGNVLHRTLGTVAYTALARSVLLVRKGKDGRGEMLPVKNNGMELGRGWRFGIESREGAARVVWESRENAEGGTMNAERKAERGTMNAESGGEGEGVSLGEMMKLEGSGAMRFAVDFLKTKLAGGAVGTVETVREARGLGISQRTLERARGELGVRCYFEKEGRRWMMTG